MERERYRLKDKKRDKKRRTENSFKASRRNGSEKQSRERHTSTSRSAKTRKTATT